VSSTVAPVLDTTGSVLLGLAGVLVVGYMLITPTCPSGDFICISSENKTKTTLVGLAGVGAATALAFSASHGYSATAECRDLKEAQLSCTSGVEASCRTLQERKPH
jgi:hypothetical protein